MSEPFLGEVRSFGFSFAPAGWALCNGQLLPINQNQALFALLGTSYGGDGITTFALPNLQGRAAVSVASTAAVGQLGGEETHVLTNGEMPAHTHAANAVNSAGTAASPAGQLWAQDADYTVYSQSPGALMSPNAVASAGNNQGHENMMPFLTVNFCIAMQGIFPSRN